MTPFRAGPDTPEEGRREPVVARSTLPPVLPEGVSPGDLTPRQAQVVAYLVQGRSTAVISHLLGIGQPAVAKYIRAAQDRIGVRSRALLVLWAIEHAAPTRSERYLARFRPLPYAPRGHRRGCPCSVCFVNGRQGRRQ